MFWRKGLLEKIGQLEESRQKARDELGELKKSSVKPRRFEVKIEGGDVVSIVADEKTVEYYQGGRFMAIDFRLKGEWIGRFAGVVYWKQK